MTIGLHPEHVSSSPLLGRVGFVVGRGSGSRTALERASAAPGAVVPASPSDLFDRGLNHVLGNYLTAAPVQGGVAALADERTVLRGLRELADEVYAAALRRLGGERLVDWSTGSLASAQAIRAIYPDAPMLVVDDGPPDPALRAWMGPATAWAAEGSGSVPELPAWPPLGAAMAPTPLPPPPAQEPVLVVGSPRSGTTWLERMLSAHPGLDGPGRETALFESLGPLWDAAQERDEGAGLGVWIDPDALLGAIRRFCDRLFAHFLEARGARPGARAHREDPRQRVATRPDRVPLPRRLGDLDPSRRARRRPARCGRSTSAGMTSAMPRRPGAP